MSDWSHAINIYRAQYLKLSIPESTVDSIVRSKTETICQFLALDKYFEPQQFPASVFKILCKEWRADLLRANTGKNIHWPAHYASKLEYWAKKYCTELVLPEVSAPYQTAAIYFPIVAGQVVACNYSWEEVLGTSNVNYYRLRQLIELDRTWFEMVFQFSVKFYSNK